MKTINGINYVEFELKSPIVKSIRAEIIESQIKVCKGIITFCDIKTSFFSLAPTLHIKFLIPENMADAYARLTIK